MSQRGPYLGQNGRNKYEKPQAHFHMIRGQSIKFQISPMKDVRGVAEKDWTDRRTDGMNDGRTHTQTEEGYIYSPPPLCRVSMNRYPAGT